ncbi:MAG: peptidylprolyl isomerase [Actinobacteria bacterium]|nr:peptidylprolyl isomerase [Actinomycetota bacterium]MCB8995905.1 peptidylprolyl isomerase [Actinomycetota bacterium]MCB9415136.1 peptidylprolyl isomerase [Actinomycetota bacterium]MCB9424622.1 peptidylprolyl isomerase [Actinomycetota bacterium]HRY08512.1 peptidylprolyl isomerase [Candidatus Nanopelagicales bacterium]
MSTKKRRQELARAKAQRQAQRRAEAAKRGRRNRLIGIVAAGAVVAGAIVWAAWPSSTEQAGAEAEPETTTEPTTSPDETAAATPGPVATPAGVTCDEPGEPRQDTRTWNKPTDQKLSGDATWVLNTNCGRITVALDAEAAPKNVNALAFLTDEGYYTGNFCHRLTTSGIFVLQCGSPGSDGTGDVGFTVPDENLPTDGQDNYPAGTVAMANRGADTASSQFFLVYKDTTLPAAYTSVGKITDGLDVVKYVAAAGVQPGSSDASDGPPAQPIVIKTAAIEN